MREGRPHLGLLDGPESWWLHEIRQGLQLAEWRKAGNGRNDMRSIESIAGIDKLATTDAMNSTKIPLEQREEPEDEEHVLWRCPKDPESVAWADMGPSTRAHSISCNTLPDNVLSDERFGRRTWSNDSVVAWIDGACVCNQDARFRRAGCGIFYGIDDDRNCSFTLPGPEQTNNRAELLAVITAMGISRSDRTVNMMCESRQVVHVVRRRKATRAMPTCGRNLRLLRRNTTRRLGFEAKDMRRRSTVIGCSSSRCSAGIDRNCHRQAAYGLGHAQFCC